MTEGSRIQTVQEPRVWFEDGILYNDYGAGEISLSITVDIAKRCIKALDEQQVKIAPIIADFRGVQTTSFHMKISDYAKIIQSFNILHRISGIWIVGMKEELRRGIEKFNQAFFGGKIQFVSTIEDAKDAIRSMSVKEPIHPSA